MTHYLLIHHQKPLAPFLLTFILMMMSACSSPSIREVDTIKQSHYLTPEIQFTQHPDFIPNDINCIAVGEFENLDPHESEDAPEGDISMFLRKAVYGVLSTKNYRDIELARVDHALERDHHHIFEQLDCDSLLTGKIIKFHRTSFISYALTSLEVEIELTNQSETVLWKAWYGARSHDGNPPLSPLSLMTGIIDVAADKNEKTYALIDTAARQIINILPDRAQLPTPESEPLYQLWTANDLGPLKTDTQPQTPEQLLADGQYELALELARESLNNSDNDQANLIIASKASLLLGRPEDASRFALDAVRIDKTNASALNVLGLSYLKQNNLPLAEGAFKKIIADGNGRANDFYNLAMVQMVAKEYDKASLNFYATGQMAMLEHDKERLYFSLKKLQQMKDINALAALKYIELGNQIQTYLQSRQ